MTLLTVPVDEYPVENAKYRFSEKYSCGGGPAATAAFLLGKWGMDTTIACAVGSDDFGNNIKKEFATVGVSTDFIETNYDKETLWGNKYKLSAEPEYLAKVLSCVDYSNPKHLVELEKVLDMAKILNCNDSMSLRS